MILADDLTGAADTAARCWGAGLPATICLSPPSDPLPGGAIAVTSDSRHLPPEQARARVYGLAREMRSHVTATWYKKIDSTLRGNLGAELDALLDVWAADGIQPCVVVSPAFPAQARGLEGGYLVHAQTPPHTVHLPTLLSQQSDHPVGAILLSTVRAGEAELARQMADQFAQGVRLLVVDALTDNDLAALVTAVQTLPDILFCGSAGLVGVLARDLASQASAERAGVKQGAPGALPPDRPIVTVVGSGSPMAHRQIRELIGRRNPARIVVAPHASGIRTVVPADIDAGDWLLHLSTPTADVELEGTTARELVAALAQQACAVVERIQPACVIVVGGDTAIHVLGVLGVERLTVIDELLPGMPLAVGTDRDGRSRTFVLKAGNHGAPATLDELVIRLRRPLDPTRD